MKKFYRIIFILAVYNYGLAQNANVILQVNDQVLNGSVANIFLTFPYEDSVKNPVGYYPGELIIGDEVWNKINYLENEKFTLHFDYYTYHSVKQDIAHFTIELDKYVLSQPYLIINIYDFRDKKYKKWYQCLTDKNYLSQLIYPQCGLYVRCSK